MLKKTKKPRNVEMDFVSPVCEPLKLMQVDHAWWSPLLFPLFKKNLAGLTSSFGTCIIYSLVQNKNKKIKQVNKLSEVNNITFLVYSIESNLFILQSNTFLRKSDIYESPRYN